MNMTLPLSIVSILVGLIVLLFSVTVFGTPVTDVGMLSTSLVFVILGGLGLLLARFQAAEDQATL